MTHRLRKISLFILVIILVLTGCEQKNNSSEVIQLGITQIVEHPSLEDIRKGIMEALSENGFKEDENINIEFKNAQGNIENTQLIAKSFNKKDVVVAITTPSAQSAFNNLNDMPIVFSGVTDPESAGIVGKNITGVSDMTPIRKQLELLKTLIPNAKRVGIIYNSSELNSEVQVNIAKEEAEKLGLELEIASITNTNEISPALDKVIKNVDALYTHVDNSLASAYPLIVKKCDELNVPIIGAVDDYVKQGALAAEGINNYKVGYQTGEMIVRILKGENISDIPYETLQETELIINKDAANKYNITLPDTIKERAIFR
ncbi:ABC transporter substrate-binding protein [Oceanirhabdus sp. W0125-5]|uniref:ABC transporter substrate-binding protein n=1 Tax=Oceanirhabdus sp. W0125-5 TaxID=2999116 RepID=UPI0022F310A7|nr:ABC transporter substrate-binding protein [Oceanirhabdus sp. W0125-5]WBW97776.1 ABC transporter substrate-binding protein [Oceanirhabdus sp. W0125-5]